jgi:hypothetical protein
VAVVGERVRLAAVVLTAIAVGGPGGAYERWLPAVAAVDARAASVGTGRRPRVGSGAAASIDAWSGAGRIVDFATR